MQFMLMHRDVPVLQFAIFDDRNWAHIVDVLNAAHVPVNMLVLDALIANEDRHWGNFGALRDSESLEFIGLEPVFDNGNSLGYKSLYGDCGT